MVGVGLNLIGQVLHTFLLIEGDKTLKTARVDMLVNINKKVYRFLLLCHNLEKG